MKEAWHRLEERIKTILLANLSGGIYQSPPTPTPGPRQKVLSALYPLFLEVDRNRIPEFQPTPPLPLITRIKSQIEELPLLSLILIQSSVRSPEQKPLGSLCPNFPSEYSSVSCLLLHAGGEDQSVAAENELRECLALHCSPGCLSPSHPPLPHPPSRQRCEATISAAPSLTIHTGIHVAIRSTASLGLHYLSIIISYIKCGRDPALPVSDSVRR